MMDDDPLAEIRGRPIDDPTEWSALHPRDRAKMRRLHDWLSRPLWSGTLNPAGVLPWPEGVCVLAGIEPEMSADAGAAGWALMPGALAFYGFASFPRDQHEVMQLFMTAEEHIFSPDRPPPENRPAGRLDRGCCESRPCPALGGRGAGLTGAAQDPAAEGFGGSAHGSWATGRR